MLDSVLVRHGRDRVSLLRLIEEYQQPVGSYLLHLIGECDVALELTRETFVRAGRTHAATKNAGGPDAALRPWLYRVATRLAFTHLRRQQRRLARMPGWELDRPVVFPAAQESDEGVLVQSALADLPIGERAVLLLCDLERLPDDEAAAVLSVGIDRLHERLRQARNHFRHAYLAHDALVSHAQNGTARADLPGDQSPDE